MDDLEILDSARLRALGVDASRAASLTRLRRGRYARTDSLERADVEARYLARIRAASASRDRVVLALESALALHGLPFGPEPAYVFSTGDPAASGSRAGIRNSHLPIPEDAVAVVDGLLCSDLAWTLADVARRRLPGPAVAAIDAALRSGRVHREHIEGALQRQSKQGRTRARWSIAFADPRSESVGESRSRVAIALLGFPAPELQVETRTDEGTFRSDFGWQRPTRWLLGEFDGMVKYGELAQQSGRTGAEVLGEEKWREDALRRSADVCRWTWGDVMDPGRLQRILVRAGLPQRARMLPPGVRLLR